MYISRYHYAHLSALAYIAAIALTTMYIAGIAQADGQFVASVLIIAINAVPVTLRACELRRFRAAWNDAASLKLPSRDFYDGYYRFYNSAIAVLAENGGFYKAADGNRTIVLSKRRTAVRLSTVDTEYEYDQDRSMEVNTRLIARYVLSPPRRTDWVQKKMVAVRITEESRITGITESKSMFPGVTSLRQYLQSPDRLPVALLYMTQEELHEAEDLLARAVASSSAEH